MIPTLKGHRLATPLHVGSNYPLLKWILDHLLHHQLQFCLKMITRSMYYSNIQLIN